MPTYEYACKTCGEHLEVVQSFSEDPLTVCPNCGGELRKVFGSVGIVFKGSGFYKTDSRKTSAGGSSPKETKSPAASSDSKSETAGAKSAPAETKTPASETKSAAASS